MKLQTLVDTHAHLTFEQFDQDRDAVIERALKIGLEAIILIGAGKGLDENRKVISLAEKDEHLFASVGIHPHDVGEMNEAWLAEIEQLAVHEKVVAIGEIGLDFYRDYAPRALQFTWFERQLQLAQKIGFPIIIHNRDAHEEILRVLKQVGIPKRGGVFHSFSGGIAFAKKVLDLGFFLSITGVVTFKNAHDLREIVAYVPIDRLLLETDCPYLAPDPYRGRRNEPAYVLRVAEKIAEVKGVSVEEVAEVTTKNALRFFNIIKEEI